MKLLKLTAQKLAMEFPEKSLASVLFWKNQMIRFNINHALDCISPLSNSIISSTYFNFSES